MKRTYICPQIEIVKLAAQCPMLLPMSNTGTDTQFAPPYTPLDDEE